MNERRTTILEAWQDFEKEVLPELKGTMPWKEYNKLQQARRDHIKGLLRESRIKKILAMFPNRYEILNEVIIHEP